jgi:hypothetical protein
MVSSSGFAVSAAVIVFSSSAMPQIGHAPGAARTICGCIGQVHSRAALEASETGPLAGAGLCGASTAG